MNSECSVLVLTIVAVISYFSVWTHSCSVSSVYGIMAIPKRLLILSAFIDSSSRCRKIMSKSCKSAIVQNGAAHNRTESRMSRQLDNNSKWNKNFPPKNINLTCHDIYSDVVIVTFCDNSDNKCNSRLPMTFFGDDWLLLLF